MPKPPTITWAAHSVSGTRKPQNDDAWLVFTSGADRSKRQSDAGNHCVENYDLVLAVSDGMGGGRAGHLASRIVLSHFSKLIPETIKAAAQGFNPDYLDHIEEAIFTIHEYINNHGHLDPLLMGMAATLTMSWVTPKKMYIAHVGDSRLYCLRNGETQQLTDDHSYTWKLFKEGEIREYAYRDHPRRNVVYEIMGAGHSNLKPSIFAVDYLPGDRYMLCSDGIVDGLWEKQIHKMLNQPNETPEETSKNMLDEAILLSGSDDTTIIVFDIKE